MSNGNGGWMPLYIGDYLSDTMELDAAQHGAYLLLLMYYWRNGPLPLEDTKLAQIARTELRVWKKTVGPIIRAFFHERDGRLHQKRADLELAKADELGEKAAEKRHQDNERLRAWRANRRPSGTNETRFKGVSEGVSDGVSNALRNADETLDETLPPQTPPYHNHNHNHRGPPFIPPLSDFLESGRIPPKSGGNRSHQPFKNGFLQLVASEGILPIEDDEPDEDGLDPVARFLANHGLRYGPQ